MSSEISTNKILITSKPIESRWLVISNLPETATEKTIKECFERYGRIQSVKIDDQRSAFVAFLDIRTALKAHQGENILDEQQLRTAFYDGSNLISKILRETSPETSSIIEPSSSSPSSITTTTNTLMDKTITTIHDDRDKRPTYSPEENTRHQVVPMKHDSNSSGNKRKLSLMSHIKTNKIKSTQRKHDDSSSSSSERSHDDRYTSKFKHQSSKTKILKISHLPSKMSNKTLRETLRNIFLDFKKSSHLLTIKIIDDYALLTFENYEDVDKALLFIITKSINGIRLKAEPYDRRKSNKYNLIQRSDIDIDQYSSKATRTLYIGNLPSEISYQELREIYSVYGEIIEIEIKRQQSQHSFAFIQYTNIKSVVKVLKSKLIHDHLIKLGFGKSQPTNVLWLDDFPSNVTELMLRTYLNRLTDLSSNEILDIYIDNQTNESIQCLIYFSDIIAAQTAINSIRGKKIETKRIQVDFASRVFLTKFSDIIQQTNQKKTNNHWINRSDRRYSKMSDTSSSITHHHSSSSSSNHKELIKSDSDEHANTSRIFDWLMKNHHSNVNDDEDDHSEKQISNSKLIENKKKEIFQTKIIPLTSDALLIQSDIRLKIYTSLYKQTINSICLPLPKFAQYLSKNSIIINPKAHLKHLLIKQQTIQHEDFVIDKELNERIKLLDKQLDQINQNQNIQTSTITCHPIILTPSSEKPDISSMKFKRKTILPLLSAIPALPISSNTTDSPLFPTPKSATSTSAIGNQNNFRTLTFSPASQKPISNNSPKPTVLKSILKQPSNQSQSISNETRKAVHIISTNSSVESSHKQKLPSNNTKKTIIQQQTETKKTLKTIETPPPVATNVFQSTAKPVHPPNKITKPIKLNKNFSLLKPLQQNKTNTILKKKFKSSETTCMYDRIKKRARIITKASMKKETDKSIIFDSEIFDTDEKKINQQQKKILPKFNKKDFILKRKSKKRRSIDQENKSSKKIKSELKLNEEQIIKSEIISTENVISTKDDVINSTIKIPINDDDDQLVNIKVETIQLEDTIDIKSTDELQEDGFNKQEVPIEKLGIDKLPEKIDHQAVVIDKSIPSTSSSEMTKPSCISSSSSSTTNETLNQFDSRPKATPKHSSTSVYHFPQIPTSDHNLFTPPHHQHFPYPYFLPPDSPPSSTRTLSTSSCSSITGNPFYNTMPSGQQHCLEKDSRRDSLTRFSTASSPYPRSSIDSISPFRNPSDLYGYPNIAQQILNNFASEYYRSCDSYDIQWEGNIILKTEQAYIKTQLVAGNSQIARITINYWNSDLNHNLRISQRMRLEEIQLDGVKKHMQMINDHCIFIAEPNGLTPDEIRLEQTHLKTGIIDYLNEKKAAGILNILLPGVLQPVYVVHIFPPCEFASEILRKRAPDAYRCVVQNKIEQIYLLFIITSTI